MNTITKPICCQACADTDERARQRIIALAIGCEAARRARHGLYNSIRASLRLNRAPARVDAQMDALHPSTTYFGGRAAALAARAARIAQSRWS